MRSRFLRRPSELNSGMDYLRATLFTRQSQQALANSQMGVWAADQYRLMQLFLHMSGNWHE